MQPVEPKLYARKPPPPLLQELLVREAVFDLSRKQISAAVVAAQQELATISASKPLLSFVRGGVRKDHQQRLAEAEEGVRILEAGVRKLDATIPALHACVERSLENHLRASDPEYIRGLSASRFSDDWKRFYARFEMAAEAFLTALNRMPERLETVLPNDPCGTHFDGRQLIEDLVTKAGAVQDEIAFLNRVAEAQRLRGTGRPPSLERQPDKAWRSACQTLLTLSPLAAAKVVKTLAPEASDALEQAGLAIKDECRLATYSGGYGVTSYHEKIWISLRETALLQVPPDQLEHIVSETEEMLEAGRLAEYVPERIEPDATPAAVATASPAPMPGTAAGTPTSAGPPKLTLGTPAAQRPLPKPPQIAVGEQPFLNEPERAATEAARPRILKLPARGTGVPPTVAAAGSPAPSAEEAARLAETVAEKERLEALLQETRQSLSDREKFLSQSEARLMEASQAQIERETELEQREEQLRDLERRLRALQSGAPVDPPPPPSPPKPRDEFNE
jgi:hypothetical protein